MKELHQQKIYLIKKASFTGGRAPFFQQYFRDTVPPELEPILLGGRSRSPTSQTSRCTLP
ncbi:MAG: hypothetical protein CM15mP103_05120 [Gammaproteobacteria bacterium]|nr:MAG: hypothetical protein CM15mP103_05120 [Gammaproteobacteria bacterium]